MVYYADWISETVPPDVIPYSRLDWIDFAFAVPTSEFQLTWDDSNAPLLLNQVVKYAHENGTKVKLSIGGWTGSRFFSLAVSTAENRRSFVDSITKLYQEHALDGVEIDWEYPGREGALGNQVDHKDSDNFLQFLQLLRISLPSDAKITAAVSPEPFADQSGQPMKECSEFAKVLDWVLLMNYDTFDDSSTFGPNAPLFDGCKNSTQQDANAVGAYNAWTRAGFPANKIVLGIPSYGYIHRSTSNKNTSSMTPAQSDDGQENGSVTVRNLVKQNIIDKSFQPLEGWTREWDSCSSTPFLRDLDGYQAVSYDDDVSLGMKAKFAREMGMLGTNMFELSGDTPDWILLDAVREGLGLRRT
ncbi:glycoside hydrolase family 18 protein [Dendrothele bispora CBS 962.96]|uniref:Glycoside hydrolase family 18 protein n=1 Tax=Dendrothele bispora (strain CBS 962.96) TaxID=1314807 RepID=A0A4S8N0N0_DENBC|nr:glycoside hydrolase family 18 protein [Dendrothele bispora CBS 962.96]